MQKKSSEKLILSIITIFKSPLSGYMSPDYLSDQLTSRWVQKLQKTSALGSTSLMNSKSVIQNLAFPTVKKQLTLAAIWEHLSVHHPNFGFSVRYDKQRWPVPGHVLHVQQKDQPERQPTLARNPTVLFPSTLPDSEWNANTGYLFEKKWKYCDYSQYWWDGFRFLCTST